MSNAAESTCCRPTRCAAHTGLVALMVRRRKVATPPSAFTRDDAAPHEVPSRPLPTRIRVRRMLRPFQRSPDRSRDVDEQRRQGDAGRAAVRLSRTRASPGACGGCGTPVSPDDVLEGDRIDQDSQVTGPRPLE